jgi:diguanylate cyclase (GGDEF)-like protein
MWPQLKKWLCIDFYVLGLVLGIVLCCHRPGYAKGPEHPTDEPGRHLTEQGIVLTAKQRAFLNTHPVIRVGNEDDWPPFDYSEHGVPKGYAIDHLELLGRKLGISFEYVNGHSWAELLALFRQGKIDVLPSLWISDSRREFMRFTDPFLELPYVIVTAKKNSTIMEFDDLKGKTVSVATGYIQEEVLESSFPSIGLHRVKNPLQGLKAITFGQADAYIGYRGVVDHIIARQFLSDLQIVGECHAPGLGPQGLYIGVRKALGPLVELLQKAMDTVTEKQKVLLSQKWISVQPGPFVQLTEKERAYLRKNRVLRVDNLKRWPPFSFWQNNSAKGFCVDYMRLLANKLDVEIEFVSGPTWDEFMKMLDAGTLDLLMDVVKTEERRRFISFTEPYLTIFSGIVFRRRDRPPEGLGDLDGRTVAVPKNFYHEEILKKHYPGIKVITAKDTLGCLKIVSSGKAYAALAEKPVTDHLITTHFLTDLESIPILGSAHFKNTPLSIGVRKERVLLRDILQKAMNSVSDQEMAVLYQRWFEQKDIPDHTSRVPLSPEQQVYLNGKQKIRVCTQSQWMPFEGRDPEGRYVGIFADIMQSIASRIGKPVVALPAMGWQESVEAFQNGRCEILSSVAMAEKTLEKTHFTRPYFESVNVMVARDETPFINGLKALSGRRVAVAAKQSILADLTRNYPGIRVMPMDDVDQALAAVAAGEADVAIDNLERVSYKIRQNRLYDLKIAGQTPYKDYVRMGIKYGDTHLSTIMDKALGSLSDTEVDKITQKWLSTRFEYGFDYRLFWQVLAAVAVVLIAIMFWNRKLSRLNRELENAHAELEGKSLALERLSVTDAMTGLYNRMKIENLLEYECRRASRSPHALSIIMLDVDTFKAINDTHGHHVGDQVLTELAGILTATVRDTDMVGRWGGEEFLILCPETGLAGAKILAEKLRKAVAGYNFATIGRCTCSFGAACHRQGDSAETVLIRADKAMYQAKAGGRNRVMAMEPS